jgi:hypothetical protein
MTACGRCLEQITKELKEYHGVEDLADIRVIKDKQTSMFSEHAFSQTLDNFLESSRGFGFIRFPTLEKAKTFVERNYPTLHLHCKAEDGHDEAATVRVAYSRERGGERNERAEGEWECKIVS